MSKPASIVAAERRRFGWIEALILTSLSFAAPAGAQGTFNQAGNLLITDQFNNRVIEIGPAGDIVWHFGNGPGDTSANAIVGTNDAERVGILTLMISPGKPAALQPGGSGPVAD
jgi:hypothetical protein